MQIGQLVLQQYTIAELIGEGGMGMVYRAVDQDGGSVAVKHLRADIAATPGLMARFAREASAHALLSHPHIATLHAVGATDEGEVFFVMELVVGESLAERVERGPLPLAQALLVAKQVLSALHHAHQFGIVHRDLKPDNVLLDDSTGQLTSKLIDFGIVKLLQNVLEPQQCERLTATGVVFGTPRYMPPEQIRGEPVDARTDLYSMGTMLFEMLTGRAPYESEEISELWNMHLGAAIPSVTAHASVPLPSDLDAIVGTLLAKSPAERFGSALAVLHALESIAV